MKEKAVILLSGGMDSVVTMAMAIEKGFEPCALHLNYKQRTEKRELRAFEEICKHYEIKQKLVVDVSYLSQIGGSSLTDEQIKVTKANLESKEIPSSYVPFRNANILSIGVSWAEVLGAKAVLIGAVQNDAVGYPDCRQSFYDAFNVVIKEGTKPTSMIEIITPIINFKKVDVVRKGKELSVPFELSWSCYQGESEACGECDSCAYRLKGFEQAGYKDPILYKKDKAC